MITTAKTSSILQGMPKYRSMLAGNSAYIPNSFESISTVVGTGSVSSFNFSSIPSTFKHLQIRGIFNDGGYNLVLRFNSDTGSNYARHGVNAAGTTPSANAAASQTAYDTIAYGASGVTSNVSGIIIDILDYSSASKYKTVRVFGSYTDGDISMQTMISSGLWMSTSAINNIFLGNLFAGNYSSTTTFALYGIKDS